MFEISNVNTIELSKYGELGEEIHTILNKYDANEDLSVIQEEFILDSVNILNNKNIKFFDKLLIISTLINNSEEFKKNLF